MRALAADYLLSNNHLSTVIAYRFQKDDEDIAATFIQLLKCLSTQLNSVTINFFINEVRRSFRVPVPDRLIASHRAPLRSTCHTSRCCSRQWRTTT